jgi:hypothetical protein
MEPRTTLDARPSTVFLDEVVAELRSDFSFSLIEDLADAAQNEPGCLGCKGCGGCLECGITEIVGRLP